MNTPRRGRPGVTDGGLSGPGPPTTSCPFRPRPQNEQVTITSDDPLPLDSLVSVDTRPKVLGTGCHRTPVTRSCQTLLILGFNDDCGYACIIPGQPRNLVTISSPTATRPRGTTKRVNGLMVSLPSVPVSRGENVWFVAGTEVTARGPQAARVLRTLRPGPYS
jgi:hypothetical protein